MGGMQDELKAKIEEMEEVNTAGRKLINVAEFQKRKQKMEESYIWINNLWQFVAPINHLTQDNKTFL